jgi:hypothetical protein
MHCSFRDKQWPVTVTASPASTAPDAETAEKPVAEDHKVREALRDQLEAVPEN